jgi:hypothetical protein
MADVSGAKARGGRETVSGSVDLSVTTPDNLRHIEFGLEMDNADGTVSWTINFKLQERKTDKDSFVDIVTLTIKVKQKYHEAAQATKAEGLSPAQQEHLAGPATVAAKQLAAQAVPREQACRVIENTLAKH